MERYLINVDYVPKEKNPNAWWDSYIKNKIVETDDLLKTIEELLKNDGALNKKLKPVAFIYRNIDDNTIETVGFLYNVYTEDYQTRKKMYFEAWVEIYKLVNANLEKIKNF